MRRRLASASALAVVADLTLPVGTRLVRMVLVGPDAVVVVDEVHGDGAGAIEVGWNLRADSVTGGADRLAVRTRVVGSAGPRVDRELAATVARCTGPRGGRPSPTASSTRCGG